MCEDRQDPGFTPDPKWVDMENGGLDHLRDCIPDWDDVDFGRYEGSVADRGFCYPLVSFQNGHTVKFGAAETRLPNNPLPHEPLQGWFEQIYLSHTGGFAPCFDSEGEMWWVEVRPAGPDHYLHDHAHNRALVWSDGSPNYYQPTLDNGERTTPDNLYLIQSEQGEVKIGVSVNPRQRLDSLQQSSPYELILLHTVESDRALELESELHERYSEHRLEGEWFDLPEEALKKLCEVGSAEEILE